MNVKMKEYYQGSGVKGTTPEGQVVAVLEPGKEYSVDKGTGDFLLEHGKAEQLFPEPQPVPEPEPEPEPKEKVKAAPKRSRSKK